MSDNRTETDPSNPTALALDTVVNVRSKRVLVFLIPNSATNVQIQLDLFGTFLDVTNTFEQSPSSMSGYTSYYIQNSLDTLLNTDADYLNGDYKLVQGS